MNTYTIENTFNDLKDKAFNTRNHYINEYYYFCDKKKDLSEICLKISNTFDRYTKWIYDIDKNDQNMIKYINRILKAYKKIENYKKLLSY